MRLLCFISKLKLTLHETAFGRFFFITANCGNNTHAFSIAPFKKQVRHSGKEIAS